MLGMLVYYDATGAVVEVRRSQVMPLWLAQELGVAYVGVLEATGQPFTTRDGDVAVLANFEAHEEAGGAMMDYGSNGAAVGAATWPEWLHLRDLRDFALEFEPGWSRHDPQEERPAFRLRALVHKISGHRRERTAVESAIATRIAEAGDQPADIRDLVGGPERPLRLDDEGRTRPSVLATAPV